MRELREKTNITLRTTMLVGYPGETESDFQALLEFIKETRFERLGAFAQSRRRYTKLRPRGSTAGRRQTRPVRANVHATPNLARD